MGAQPEHLIFKNSGWVLKPKDHLHWSFYIYRSFPMYFLRCKVKDTLGPIGFDIQPEALHATRVA